MRRRGFIACSAAFLAAGMRRANANSVFEAVKMPLQIENNRIYAYFGYPGANGSIRRVLTNIDTGGGAVIIARKTADALGLSTRPAADAPPGTLQLDLHDVRAETIDLSVPFAATTAADTSAFHPGASSPAFLPGAVLAPHAVTFDYTNAVLLLDGPPLVGAAPIVVHVSKSHAFPRVELEIDGERLGFLLDTGASFSMLSQAVIDRLRAKHPNWTYVQGAYGPANMIGKGDAAAHMLRIPAARLGAFEFDLNVVSRPVDIFEKWMSPMMSAPIVGSLAGNALRNFALRLDYAGSMLDAVYTPRPWDAEFTIVPVILQAEQDGTYTIAGGTGAQSVTNAKLLAVDGYSIAGMSLFQVQDSLRGKPGSTRAVRVQAPSGERTVRMRVEKVF